MTLPLPTVPQHAPYLTVALMESLQVMSTTQQTKLFRQPEKQYACETLGGGDPQNFSGSSYDLTVVELWLNSIETVFGLTNCPNDQKVPCAWFML